MGFFRSIKDTLRPLLSDKTILKMNQQQKLIHGKLTSQQVQPNSIDLTLADSVKVPKNNFIYVSGSEMIPVMNPMLKMEYDVEHFETGEYQPGKWKFANHRKYYILEPGKFVLMASREILDIPNGYIGFVQGRSSIARMGIQTEQAGLIDAGFTGTITFEVINNSEYPILLFEGMRIAQVYFFKAQYADKIYGIAKHSKYSRQIAATESRIHLDAELHSPVPKE